MKRCVPGLVIIIAMILVVSRYATTAAAGKAPMPATRAAIAFDLSPPLESMEQFIPDKPVAIHPAVESLPVRQGATQGPGKGLALTPPAPPVSSEARSVTTMLAPAWRSS